MAAPPRETRQGNQRVRSGGQGWASRGGLAFARLSKGVLVKLGATALGFSLAVITHAFHNSFLGVIGGLEGSVVESLIDWTGWLLMAVFIVFMIARERGLLKRQL